MHKLLNLFLATLVMTLAGCSSKHLDIFPELSDPMLVTKMLTPAQLREDADAMLQGILERHPDVEGYADLPEIEQRLEALKMRLSTPMTRTEFYKEVGALSHLFNDGHTFLIWPYQEFQALKEQDGLTFPFTLEVFPKGVFLKHEYSNGTVTLPKGTELVAINNIPMTSLFTHMQQFVGGETDILRKHIVADRFPQMLWAVYGFENEFEIVAQVNGNEERVLVSENAQWKVNHQGAEDTNNDFSYSKITDGIGYLKVATFDVSPDWFEEFIDETFQQINQQGIDKLIIDIRENGGGNTDTATYLARHLANKPFRMISMMLERLNADNRGLFDYRGEQGEVLQSEWDDWVTPMDKGVRFEGDAYVLVSPLSYSSAIVFATAVQDNGMATLVGRETGGYANQTAQGNLFNLPNSELRIYVATRMLVRPNGNAEVSGVIPDIVVTTSDEQIREGVDADIQAAINN